MFEFNLLISLFFSNSSLTTSSLQISDTSVSNRERLENAFAAAEREFGVTRLIDPEDVDTENPDEKSLITYVSSLYNALPHLPELSKVCV